MTSIDKTELELLRAKAKLYETSSSKTITWADQSPEVALAKARVAEAEAVAAEEARRRATALTPLLGTSQSSVGWSETSPSIELVLVRIVAKVVIMVVQLTAVVLLIAGGVSIGLQEPFGKCLLPSLLVSMALWIILYDMTTWLPSRLQSSEN